MLNFRLDWPPTVNTYWRWTYDRNKRRPVVLLSARARAYKSKASGMMLEQGVRRGVMARVELLIEAYPPDKRKRDLDNILKPILDVLQDYGVIEDDEQVDIITIRRRSKGGYVEIHIAEIPPEDSLS